MRYWYNSVSRHSVHSPFVYNLINDVFRSKDTNNAVAQIEELKNYILLYNQLIEDYNLESQKNIQQSNSKLPISFPIITTSNKKHYDLLFRLVQHFKPKTILELDSQQGINTLMMSIANPEAWIHTFQEDEFRAKMASEALKRMQATNIQQYSGLFEQEIDKITKQTPQFDFIVLNNTHNSNVTYSKFEALLPLIHHDTIIVMHAIHSSKEMEEIWNKITDHTQVTVSIDLFVTGILFFKRELSKQKFIIRF